MEKYKEVDLGSDKLPYTIAFAFPRAGPIVVKGSLKEVQDYIWNELTICHYKITYWDNRRKINENWYINNNDWNIVYELYDSGKKRYIVTLEERQMFAFRRLPKHFIEELSCFEKTLRH